MMNHQDVIVAKQAEEETINKVKLVGSMIRKFHPRDNGMVQTTRREGPDGKTQRYETLVGHEIGKITVQ